VKNCCLDDLREGARREGEKDGLREGVRESAGVCDGSGDSGGGVIDAAGDCSGGVWVFWERRETRDGC
jgi:hypothetical protein